MNKMDSKELIARRVAREIEPGMLVNLGIGLPSLVAGYVDPRLGVFFQAENGVIGLGARPPEGMHDKHLTDAGGAFVTAVPGVGGAMDLVTGAKRVVVAMQHTARGEPKIVKHCNLPLTSVRSVDLVVTDLAVIRCSDGRLHLMERAPGVSVDDIVAATAAPLVIDGDIPVMPLN